MSLIIPAGASSGLQSGVKAALSVADWHLLAAKNLERSHPKVLFLDVDGVLNHARCKARLPHDPRFRGIMRKKVEILNRILEQTDAAIVLSSSWRKPNNEREKKFLLEKGGIHDIKRRYLGDTPILQPQHLSEVDAPREDEIAAWIKEHDFQGRFAIVDDLPDMGPLTKHFFRTSDVTGLTDEVADRMIARLNGTD